ncbi:hypothetical protein [Streptomyces sp. NPDC002403]
MARTREVYCFDHVKDFGLSCLAGTHCSRATLRTDAPVVLALAGAQAKDEEYEDEGEYECEDDRLGRDVRPLLDSPLPDEVLRAVWPAAVRRCFDPVGEYTDTRWDGPAESPPNSSDTARTTSTNSCPAGRTDPSACRPPLLPGDRAGRCHRLAARR